MTKHRRITGLVAIVLLAVATAATMGYTFTFNR